MLVLVQRVSFALMALMAAGVAVVSARYLAPGMPGGAPPVLANAFADPWLVWHAGAAATALLLGPFQFVGRRNGRRAVWHRLTGAVYMAACLVGGVSGLVLAIGTTAGPIAAAGFGALAVAWLLTTALGLRALLARRYGEHGRWMVRSFALTFAAVALRLYLPLSNALGLDMALAYVAISWLCWVPNLLVAEALFLRRPRRPALQTA